MSCRVQRHYVAREIWLCRTARRRASRIRREETTGGLRRGSGSVGPAMRTAASTARGPAAADMDRAPPPILGAVPPCWPRIAAPRAAGGRWVTTTGRGRHAGSLLLYYRWHPCVASVTPSPPHPAHISAVLVQTVAQLPPHGCPARMLISSARPARCPLSIGRSFRRVARCSFQARYTALYIYIAGSSTSRANQFQRSVSWYKPT